MYADLNILNLIPLEERLIRGPELALKLNKEIYHIAVSEPEGGRRSVGRKKMMNFIS